MVTERKMAPSLWFAGLDESLKLHLIFPKRPSSAYSACFRAIRVLTVQLVLYLCKSISPNSTISNSIKYGGSGCITKVEIKPRYRFYSLCADLQSSSNPKNKVWSLLNDTKKWMRNWPTWDETVGQKEKKCTESKWLEFISTFSSTQLYFANRVAQDEPTSGKLLFINAWDLVGLIKFLTHCFRKIWRFFSDNCEKTQLTSSR